MVSGSYRDPIGDDLLNGYCKYSKGLGRIDTLSGEVTLSKLFYRPLKRGLL